MTEADLDRSYTALAHALGDAGEARAPLLLATLALGLLARLDSADEATALIAQAKRRTLAEAAHG